MFTTPRKSYRGGRGRNSRTPSSSKVRLDGLFDNGQWFCNCEPRLPGLRLQVKKNNKNKGRWFYTCQKERKDQCGFFIFEDTAQVREKGTLLRTPGPEDATSSEMATASPSPAPVQRTLFRGILEGRARAQSFSTELSTDDELDLASLASRVSQQRREGTLNSQDTNHPPQHPALGHSAVVTPTAKRKLDVLEEASDEEFGGDFNSDEERQMMRLADESANSHKLSQSRAAMISGAPSSPFATPSAQRTHNVLGGLPTPLTRNTLLIASEQRGAKRQRVDAVASPTPAQSTDHERSSLFGDDYDITEEVMGILGPTPLNESVREDVRESLNRYALRVRGVERGREMARATVKAKDGKIAELQARVAALENERRVNKERIKALNTGLTSLFGEDPPDS